MQYLLKKNKFFTSGDSLKSRVFKDILPPFENHFDYLKEEGKKFLESLEVLIQKFNEFKEGAIIIDKEAKLKLEKFKDSLDIKLKDRDKLLSEFEKEKKQKITQLESSRSQIDNVYSKIKEIIQLKHNTCLQEAQNLIKWSINDNQSDLFTRPIQWIYMPLYIMFIEDEDNMEEYMNVVFPGYITRDVNNIYENLDESFIDLKKILKERVENDMATRSNFEFSSERKNIIKDPNFNKKVQIGISKLREKNLLNEAMEKILRETLRQLL